MNPKAFDNVTVFFSDIMDFSTITQKWQNNPTEIVRMLDKLYTLFDSITEQFDIYKVETIGAGVFLTDAVTSLSYLFTVRVSVISPDLNSFNHDFRLHGGFRVSRSERESNSRLLCI